ncbi:hypothetical protein NQT62_09880 [Limnobacter humi]|uniref:Tyr recombinase domain-containing protein n=1 Tax=Limnobacter humi TaxID=1778671 RepID=A0ABT1WGU6_9BURK|nr:hypothetical protein [Limnobacter humi]MCQ8896740.1 hypothetical protein [Limnobacter humi]
MQTHDGIVLFPQSHFLNFLGSSTSPPKVDSQIKYHDALKSFELFLSLEGITIEKNILEKGIYLDSHQALRLKYWLGFTYNFMKSCRQIPGRLMNAYAREAQLRKIRLITKNGRPSVDAAYVALSTYSQRVQVVSSYLKHHYRFFGKEMVNFDRSGSLRNELDEILKILKDAVPTGKPHESQISSYPQSRWYQIIELIALKPEEAFLTRGGKPSTNLMKHQLVALLCSEGLRRGAVANLRIQDHKDDGMLLVRGNEQYWYQVNGGKRKRGTASLKQRFADPRESVFHFMINPLTNFFFKQYLTQRKRIVDKYGSDRTHGFLFIQPSSGLPYTNREHVTETFRLLKEGLSAKQLLKIDDSDPFITDTGNNEYECRPHVFRHSGVCERAINWFHTGSRAARIVQELEKINAPRHIIDELRTIEISKDLSALEKYLVQVFGWAPESEMAALYAKRVEKIFANGVRSDFHDLVIELKNRILGSNHA